VFSVVKNPLAPVEHTGGAGVNYEMFELGLEQFVVCSTSCVHGISDSDSHMWNIQGATLQG